MIASNLRISSVSAQMIKGQSLTLIACGTFLALTGITFIVLGLNLRANTPKIGIASIGVFVFALGAWQFATARRLQRAQREEERDAEGHGA